MNNNSGRKQPGTTPQGTESFGKPQNQGRNAYAQNSDPSGGHTGRGRSNAIITPTTQESMGRARSNAVVSHKSPGETGPGQLINQGRTTENQQNSPPSGFKPGNLGRSSYQNAQQNRNGLTPNQQSGFNLVSGFMSKLIEQADRAGNSNNDPDRRLQQNQTMSQGVQDKADEERRRANSQMSNRDDDKVTGKEFFQRLQSAMADPEGFKKRVAEKEAGRQNQQQQQQQETNSPPQSNQQQGESITGKEFFQRLQDAMKDPQGFKRRVEAQRKQQGQEQPGQSQQPGQNQTGRDRSNAIAMNKPGVNNPGQNPTPQQKTPTEKAQPQKNTAPKPKARPKPRPKSG